MTVDWLSLPPEMWEGVIRYCDIRTHKVLTATCKTLRNYALREVTNRSDWKLIAQRWGIERGVRETACFVARLTHVDHFIIDMGGNIFRFNYSSQHFWPSPSYRVSLTINFVKHPTIYHNVTFHGDEARVLFKFIKKKKQRPRNFYFIYSRTRNYILFETFVISLETGRFVCELSQCLSFPFALAPPMPESVGDYYVGIRFNRMVVYRIWADQVTLVLDVTIFGQEGSGPPKFLSAYITDAGKLTVITALRDDIMITTMIAPDNYSTGPIDESSETLSSILVDDNPESHWRKMLRQSISGWETKRATLLSKDGKDYLRIECFTVRHQIPQVLIFNLTDHKIESLWRLKNPNWIHPETASGFQVHSVNVSGVPMLYAVYPPFQPIDVSWRMRLANCTPWPNLSSFMDGMTMKVSQMSYIYLSNMLFYFVIGNVRSHDESKLQRGHVQKRS